MGKKTGFQICYTKNLFGVTKTGFLWSFPPATQARPRQGCQWDGTSEKAPSVATGSVPGCFKECYEHLGTKHGRSCTIHIVQSSTPDKRKQRRSVGMFLSLVIAKRLVLRELKPALRTEHPGCLAPKSVKP